MEYEINSCGYDIIFDSATIDTTIGEETIIEVEQAINYIKSGEQEIKNYVDNVSKRFFQIRNISLKSIINSSKLHKSVC